MMSYWGPDYADPETYTDPFAIGQKYGYCYMAEGYGEQTLPMTPRVARASTAVSGRTLPMTIWSTRRLKRLWT